MRSDICKYGMSSNCCGCKARLETTNGAFVRAQGSSNDRIKHGTEKRLKDEGASVEFLEGGVRSLEEEIAREKRGGAKTSAWRSKAFVQNERQRRALEDMMVGIELNQMTNTRCGEMTIRADIIGVQLENALQRAQRARTPLEDGMGRIMTMEFKTNDVSEVHSPLRVAKVARQLGLAGGWSLDFITEDERGNNCDMFFFRNWNAEDSNSGNRRNRTNVVDRIPRMHHVFHHDEFQLEDGWGRRTETTLL